MTRQELTDAASHLEEASESAAEEVNERLQDLADQLTTLAEREQGPDHGRLARIQSALDEVKDDVESEAHEAIDAANDAINSFRETLEGV